MPALFLELFSEEIPARMQARAPTTLRAWSAKPSPPWPHTTSRPSTAPPHRPRRGPLAEVAANQTTERGPRATAPSRRLPVSCASTTQARISSASRATTGARQVRRFHPGRHTDCRGAPCAAPPLPLPKSMRWGGTSAFTWVRPLRRITCLLDAQSSRSTCATAPMTARPGIRRPDRGPPLPRPRRLPVTGVADWAAKLRERYVLSTPRTAARSSPTASRASPPDASQRSRRPRLLDEVAGLVEWPCP